MSHVAALEPRGRALAQGHIRAGDLPGRLGARKGRREEHGAGFSEDMAFELAHSGGRILARGASWLLCGNSLSLCFHSVSESAQKSQETLITLPLPTDHVPPLGLHGAFFIP